jgi:C-terminal processing protease CtpA/Prc
MKKTIYVLAAAIIMFGCRKNDVTAPVASTTPAAPPPVEVNYDDLVKDSALDAARDIYLWYKQIPSPFNARQYADPSAIMTAIRPYSTETGFAQSVDRWSFAVKQADWNNLGTGNDHDLGFGVFFNGVNDLRVKYVERASASGKAGIQRGWQILSINGNSNIDTSSSSIQMIVNIVYNSNSGSFKFRKPDGSTITMNLTAVAYNEHPVYADKVISLPNGKKVGYMVFNSFMGDTTSTYNDFNRVFTNFSQNNVNEVVIDLRYNGGGYVTVAERLANYLAPSSANGQVMMSQTYNDKYSQYNETVRFKKLGNLNLAKIYFIVSNSTASASELVINSLKPYLSVTLVGPTATTHGKPVGFFPIPVGTWYVFPVSFKTVNKNGEGNYYNGFTVNTRARDGVDANWGETNEACLAAALNLISGTAGRTMTSTNDLITEVNEDDRLNRNQFKGTIDPRGFKQ